MQISSGTTCREGFRARLLPRCPERRHGEKIGAVPIPGFQFRSPRCLRWKRWLGRAWRRTNPFLRHRSSQHSSGNTLQLHGDRSRCLEQQRDELYRDGTLQQFRPSRATSPRLDASIRKQSLLGHSDDRRQTDDHCDRHGRRFTHRQFELHQRRRPSRRISRGNVRS